VGDAGFLASGGGSKKQQTASVVAVVKRNWRPYCGTLLPKKDGDSSGGGGGAVRALFAPGNRQIPSVRITTRQSAELAGMRIIVAIDSWPVDSKHPVGHYVRTLGKIGDPEVETEVVLIEHGIPYQPFSEAVLAEMPEPSWTVPDSELAKRTDLRHLNVCSIDPPGLFALPLPPPPPARPFFMCLCNCFIGSR
jgi:exosome complex exonuclease DIS3/RRP44